MAVVTTATAAQAATIPTVDCTTNPEIFNTGYDSSTQSVAADATVDQRWTVAGGLTGYNPIYALIVPTTGLAPSYPTSPTFAEAYVGQANSAWATSPYGASQWISAACVSPSSTTVPGGTAGQNQTSTSGTWYYQYQFNLAGAVDPASFALSMNWLADNNVNGVWVNGVQQTGANLPQSTTDAYLYYGYRQAYAASTDLMTGWQAGLNTIIVEVNSGTVAEGFAAQVTSESLCSTLSVTKTVDSRVSADDQFTVSVADSAGTTLTSATTSGTGVSATSPDTEVSSGATYTITDAMASGSSSLISY